MQEYGFSLTSILPYSRICYVVITADKFNKGNAFKD